MEYVHSTSHESLMKSEEMCMYDGEREGEREQEGGWLTTEEERERERERKREREGDVAEGTEQRPVVIFTYK